MKCWRSWGMQFKTKSKEHWVLPFFCFMVMLGHTLLLRLKTSSPDLSDNKWTTPVQPRFCAKWLSPLPTSKGICAKWLSPLPTPTEVPGWQAIWRQRWPERWSEEVANIAGGCNLRGGYTKTCCPATISASIMAANMWKNSLKNGDSDNNKILYENLLNFF